MEDLRAGLLARLDRDPETRAFVNSLGDRVAQGALSPAAAAEEALAALKA